MEVERLHDDTISLIKENITVLEKVHPEQLLFGSAAYEGKDTIGKHFRHVFNFYESLADGVDSGIIDYEARSRDELIETDKVVALDYAQLVLNKIIQKKEHMLKDENVVLKDPLYGEIKTSVKAELVSAYEHTVHHNAIIHVILSQHDEYEAMNIDKNFGMAPSTLRYKASQ